GAHAQTVTQRSLRGFGAKMCAVRSRTTRTTLARAQRRTQTPDRPLRQSAVAQPLLQTAVFYGLTESGRRAERPGASHRRAWARRAGASHRARRLVSLADLAAKAWDAAQPLAVSRGSVRMSPLSPRGNRLGRSISCPWGRRVQCLKRFSYKDLAMPGQVRPAPGVGSSFNALAGLPSIRRRAGGVTRLMAAFSGVAQIAPSRKLPAGSLPTLVGSYVAEY